MNFYHFTDVGNAERLRDAYGNDLRHVRDWGQWLHWTGTVWARDDVGHVDRAARRTALLVDLEAVAVVDPDVKAAAVKWARASESGGRQAAMIHLAESDASIAAATDAWDQAAFELNTPSGIVDLRSASLLASDRDKMCSKITAVGADTVAACPQWLALLRWAFEGDDDLLQWFQRAVGCTLYGHQREHAFFFCFGPGRNGKGTVVNTIRRALGTYSYTLPAEFVVLKKYAQHPTELTGLFRARMAMQSEVDPTATLDESRIKQISGDDDVTARYMGKDFFSFPPTWKLWLVGNHKPRIRGTDDGIWRRMRLVPFNAVVPAGSEDRDLAERLWRDEAAAILGWCVEGARLWHEHGLGTCAAVEQASTEYRQGEDQVGQFLEDCCEVDKLVGATVTKSAVRKAYEAWCQEQSIMPVGPKLLAERFTAAGIVSTKSGAERRWRNVRLLTTPPPSATSREDDRWTH